jgi:hypothetical protein
MLVIFGVLYHISGDDLTTSIVPKVQKIRSLNLSDSQGPTQACSGKTLPITFHNNLSCSQ